MEEMRRIRKTKKK